MASRFLDTNYYKSPFVRSLKGSLKSLYSFIICDCDGAGIWNLDLESASMFTGFKITFDEFYDHFILRGKAVDIGGGKYFFPDFIDHQYPSGLQANNKAHKNFISVLTKYGLIDSDQKIIKKEAPLKEPLKGSQVMSGNGQGLGNGQGHVPNLEESEKPLFNPSTLTGQMIQVWMEVFPSYTQDATHDLPALKNIADFIFKQAGIKNGYGNFDSEIKCLNTFQLLADQVNREPFWANKPLKSISHNIQEFYNKVKNPINGTGSKSKSTSNGINDDVLKQKLAAKRPTG